MRPFARAFRALVSDKDSFRFRPHRGCHKIFSPAFRCNGDTPQVFFSTCVNSPVVDIAVLYNGLLSLRLFLLPTLEPLAHLRSGGFAANVHRGDHLFPLDRECEAGEFEERAVFRIWHSIHLEVHVGALRLLQVLPRKLPALRVGQYRRNIGHQSSPARWGKPYSGDIRRRCGESESVTYDHPVGRSPMTFVKVSFQLSA